MGKLVVLDGSDRGKEYFLRSRNILGRSGECSFVIKDKGISGKHCKIEQKSLNVFEISDMESSNGTFVNGKRILNRRLHFGDVIGLGKIRILFMPVNESKDQSTIMLNLNSLAKETNKLLHCNKPMAREWAYCPYCGSVLSDK